MYVLCGGWRNGTGLWSMVWIGKSTGNTDMMCWQAGTPHAVIVLAATCVMCLCPVSDNYPFRFCINAISAKRKKIVNQINIFACVRRLCMSVGPAACSKCFVGRKGLVAEILLKSMINWVVSCLQQCKLSVDSSGNHASCANVASCLSSEMFSRLWSFWKQWKLLNVSSTRFVHSVP